MSRRFVVKIGNSKDSKYEIHVNDTESYNDFVNKLSQEHSISDQSYFKFICKGKIITADNFNTLDSGSVLLGLICTKAQITEPTPTNIPKQIVHSPNCTCTCNGRQLNTQSTQSNPASQVEPADKLTQAQTEPTYTCEEIKSSIIVFLNFMKMNQQVNALYQNDFPQLVNEIVNNPQIGKVIQDILGQSKQILNAIKNKSNISIRVGGEDNENDHTDEVIITPDDGLVIDELIAMGFDPNEVVVTYLKNNKDKSTTIEALLLSEVNDYDVD